MTRIIRTSTPGKERSQLSKAIVITVREFMRQTEVNEDMHDMVAFVILSLEKISNGIDKSVEAWEKRGYWIKADKYRIEWLWTGDLSKKLAQAYQFQDWKKIADLLAKVMSKFMTIKISDRHRIGKPWVDASQKYQSELS